MVWEALRSIERVKALPSQCDNFEKAARCEGAPCHPLRRSIVPNSSLQTFADYAFQVLTVPPIGRDSYVYELKVRATPQRFGQLRLRRRAARLSGFGFAAPDECFYCVVIIKNIVVKRVVGYCPCAFVTLPCGSYRRRTSPGMKFFIVSGFLKSSITSSTSGSPS